MTKNDFLGNESSPTWKPSWMKIMLNCLSLVTVSEYGKMGWNEYDRMGSDLNNYLEVSVYVPFTVVLRPQFDGRYQWRSVYG
jgi:hypothetical protein